MIKSSRSQLLLLIVSLIPYAILSFYSYAFVDRNLILSAHPLFWSFQEWIWRIGFEQRQLATVAIGILLGSTFLSYWVALKKLNQRLKRWYFAGAVFALTFAYPLFSHDMFNYIFNARMVIQYQENPHVTTALEFPEDDWTRFMHNTHTSAPYGYGWTALSLPQYIVGFEKFLPTYLAFKLFASGAFVLMVYVLGRLLTALKLNKNLVWLVALHPLLLIELVGNAHNDGAMMSLALLSILLISQHKNIRALLILLVSISIKYVTVLLFPLLILWKRIQSKPALYDRWPDVISLGLLLPLLIPRSQWFHPWYLSWALVFYPLVKSKILRAVLVGLSVSAMFRYLPLFWIGEFTSEVVMTQILITWFCGGILALIWYTMKR